uniref:Uncharacterized protein n=1 Tax=Anguilla anguilla TaxID=7936 RepID=A0A0E9TLV9_ANGAN
MKSHKLQHQLGATICFGKFNLKPQIRQLQVV